MKRLFNQIPATKREHLTAEGLLEMRRKYSSKAKHNRKDFTEKSKIEMLMTFDEWLDVWLDSGHIHEMGVRSSSFCMCRKNDSGNYQVDNVFIGRAIDNVVSAMVEMNPDEQRINQLVIETGYKRSIVKRLISKGKLSI